MYPSLHPRPFPDTHAYRRAECARWARDLTYGRLLHGAERRRPHSRDQGCERPCVQQLFDASRPLTTAVS
jgi:hypothetical protein